MSIIFITLMVNSRATYTDPNLPVTNIQASIVLKITMQMFSQIFFQDDYLTEVSICLAQNEKKKSVFTLVSVQCFEPDFANSQMFAAQNVTQTNNQVGQAAQNLHGANFNNCK